ncbi:hypothetical protein G4B88_022065 [Cannabis sativa]|uniref:DUF4283 domain-containing protein n=1 Tax=Cannabis sativa TaxID=3483 RepID=A0A7J6F7T8_CANSA|nr:hypothetical protein G4B88_022065 [Cannabis sativa]
MADPTLSDLFKDSVQVTTNELTLNLNPGEVDLPEEHIWRWEEREDGLLQFTFHSTTDADNVLLRRLWLVCGYLLVLMPWPSWLTPSEVKFDQTPIWNIERNFERGSFGMGTVRFRATVDLSKPLFSGFFLWRLGLKDLWNLTVIKNGEGAFFPMYGVWMDEEAKESSPFQQPLPKWFNDWIVNKKALKDPKFRNQLKNQCIIQQAEASEWIGEVTPFKNTATGVVEKVLPDPPSIEDVSSASQCMSKGDSTSMHVDGENGCMAHIVENDNGDKLDIAEGTKVSANIAYVGTKGPGDTSKTKRLSRSNTIDKYHREPTLFNPILNIDDFRCYEAEKGPRKRKSTYGFFMLPEERPLSTSTTPEDIPLPALDNEAHTLVNLIFRRVQMKERR